LKIHQASDEHSGENLAVMRAMFAPLPLQVFRYRRASELAPKVTNPPSRIFASCSRNGWRGDFGCFPRVPLDASVMLRMDSNCWAIGVSIPQRPGPD
jgi:hypothetical protein